MLTIESILKSITGDDRGVAAIEYAIIATFMAGVLALSFPPLAKVVGNSFAPAATHIAAGK